MKRPGVRISIRLSPLRYRLAFASAVRDFAPMAFHNFIGHSEGWQTHQDEELFANPHIAVHRVHVTTPTRPKPFPWTVAHRKGAVVVAPVTAAGDFLLVRQERVPIRETIWEFPAGQIDDVAEEDHIRATGLRELREESGYELAPGGELISLGYFFPSAGFTDEHSHLLLARPVVPSPRGTSHDPGEAILGCRAFAPAEFRDMIAKGEIRDANTLSAFARMAALGIV
jgi:8-oxo-dGTP pyrophosphatase MutT (NUDIX family)